VLLQILDDGRVTDAQGRTIDCKNTVIIMTSNIGSPYLLDGVSAQGTIEESARKQVMQELRSAFRPEFLNRVDDIVLFKPLSKDEITHIIVLLTDDLRKRLASRHIGLELTPAACDFVVGAAYDPVYGARPLKRYLQHQLETKIGRAIIAGEISDGDKITIDADSQGLRIAIRP
jgi:ATP-dependent Clp protease ATP-binding subunit ClpB